MARRGVVCVRMVCELCDEGIVEGVLALWRVCW